MAHSIIYDLTLPHERAEPRSAGAGAFRCLAHVSRDGTVSVGRYHVDRICLRYKHSFFTICTMESLNQVTWSLPSMQRRALWRQYSSALACRPACATRNCMVPYLSNPSPNVRRIMLHAACVRFCKSRP